MKTRRIVNRRSAVPTVSSCVMALALLVGCFLPYPHTTPRSLGEVRGVVLDARTRAPIRGAKVVQTERSGFPPGKTRKRTTDAQGRFRFNVSHNFHLASVGPEGADWPPGVSYEYVTVSYSGYLSYETEGLGEIEILLQPVHPLDIRGRIVDARTKAPVRGVKIDFDDYSPLFCFSDEMGRFRLEGTPGFYRACATNLGSPFRDSMSVSRVHYQTRGVHAADAADILLTPIK